MKKERVTNCIITCIFFLFLLVGLCSTSLMTGTGHALINLLKSDKPVLEKIDMFIATIDSSSTYLSYEGLCKDIYSLKLAYLDKKNVVEANGSQVVRMNNGYLNGVTSFMSDEDLNDRAERIEGLCEKTESTGADFLYVAVPVKGLDGGFPEEVHSYITENTERYLNFLGEKEVPVLNLKEKMENQGITEEEAFFITDHHWIPETAFWAAGEICEDLHSSYGFSYNSDIMNIENYNKKIYKDWYLGSQGTRVGQYFTPYGADDISLIYPKFDTDLIVENPRKGEVRTGLFSDTILFQDKIVKKSLYNRRRSAYSAYSGGDMAIQTITNNLSSKNAPKILVIRDSMAACLTPYLALVSSELHTIDIRSHVVADPIVESVYEYIDDFNPDFVLVIYSVSEVDTPSAFEFK